MGSQFSTIDGSESNISKSLINTRDTNKVLKALSVNRAKVNKPYDSFSIRNSINPGNNMAIAAN